MQMEYKLLKKFKFTFVVVPIIILVILLGVFLTINLKKLEATTLTAEELKTLKFVQVIFRHGDRTSLKVYDITTDPYRNFTYPPYGVGELTNEGKQHMYKVGRELRKRYNQFLNDYYLPNLIKSTSSDTERTQVSLQLVLAGLFPPKREQIWDHRINWQPIPYKIIPKGQDQVFNAYYCPGFKKLYWEFMQRPEILQQYQNQTIYDYVSLHTGLNITRPAQLLVIYDILRAQYRFGLVLPKWTEKVYPDELRKWTNVAFDYFVGTDRLKRLYNGYLLKDLLQEIHGKINGKIFEKFSLYAGHDSNIFGMGATLDLFEGSQIPFGASILIELHEIDEIYMLKFYYVDFNQPQSDIVQQLRAKISFKIDVYSKLIQKYLPDDEECEAGPDGFPHIYDF